MNSSLIEELLNEEESATLDFKSAQYPFIGATDDEKSELLKDIIAFANAWRRTDAYILTGVEEIKGGRSKVVGIASDFDDASIQQFVNSKTNRNIEFSYKTISFEGVKIGVFHIPMQERPFYLKKDFGKLKQKTVYRRMSSSTGEADLDEIAAMGAAKFDKYQDLNIPKLELQFFGKRDKVLLGNSISVTSKILEYNEADILLRTYSPYGSAGLMASDLMANRNFEPEMAKYLSSISLVQSISFNLTNIGSTLANTVRLEIILIRDEAPILIFDKHNYPSRPQRTKYPVMPRAVIAQTSVEKSKYSWKLAADFGNIQPKASRQSDSFYIGASKPCKLNLEAKVYADNLPDPLIFLLSVNIETHSEKLDVTNLHKID